LLQHGVYHFVFKAIVRNRVAKLEYAQTKDFSKKRLALKGLTFFVFSIFL